MPLISSGSLLTARELQNGPVNLSGRPKDMAFTARPLPDTEPAPGLDSIDCACFDLALELDGLPHCNSLLPLRDREGRPLAGNPFEIPVGREEILRTRGFRMLYARALELGFDLRLQCSVALDSSFSRRWFIRLIPLHPTPA